MQSLKKIVVGISGGVDSAVSALLLKRKGYDVTGVFMKNWDVVEDGECTTTEDAEFAEYTCKNLDIPFKQVSFVKEYWNEVFCALLEDYQKGNTPNPDVLCNRKIKFDAFFKYAREKLNADAIATGHYAKTSFGCYLENFNAKMKVRLLCGTDPSKDQSFFLSQVPQEALQRTMFPVGDLLKSTVKKLAAENGLKRVAERDESTGICFIGSRNFQKFIKEFIPLKPGKIVNISTGKVEGSHEGIHMWTLGQGVNIAGVDQARYVAYKDENSVLLVGSGLNHPAFYSRIMLTEAPYWISHAPNLKMYFDCDFRFQHLKKLIRSRIFCLKSGKLLVVLRQPLRAITPGQYAVFYSGNECLGSARIERVGPTYYSLGKQLPEKYIEYFDERDVLKFFKN